MSPGLMKDETGGFANETYFSNSVFTWKQYLSDLKTANC